MSGESLLNIRDLHIRFQDYDNNGERRDIHALRGIDLTVMRGKIHALVGESGSGKSVTANAILGLNPIPPGIISRGAIEFDGKNLLSLHENELRPIRGAQVSMIFQEPSRYLSPAMRIGEQISETLRVHLGCSQGDAMKKAAELLEEVGLQAATTLRAFPHELSGGMRQRALLAIAVSCRPQLLIADEPTTALDVTIQRRILNLIVMLKDKIGMAILFISHDLAVVRQVADTISVIYAGKIVETASAETLFGAPSHPYTRLLLESIPDVSKRGQPLRAIKGQVPDASRIPFGCAFHPRCPIAGMQCRQEMPITAPFGGSQTHGVACHKAGVQWDH